MSEEVNIIIRTADQTRKAEVTLSRNNMGKDVIQAAVDNWALPTDTDYSLVNTTTGKVIAPLQSLAPEVVSAGNTLEVQPVLVAGNEDVSL